MTLGIATPFLNERPFARAWATNAKKFADEIITANTGSTDGTDEILKAEGIRVIDIHDRITGVSKSLYEKIQYQSWNHGREGIVRNRLKSLVKSDFILTLDLDELLDDRFFEVLDDIKSSPRWKFGQLKQYMFWGGLDKIRVRSLKPLLFFKGRFNPLRNWRGKYPNPNVRIYRNLPEINHSVSEKHCVLGYKNYGRVSYHIPTFCRDFDVPFYHMHYCFSNVKNGNMDSELGQEIPTLNFDRIDGSYPKELKLIQEDYAKFKA